MTSGNVDRAASVEPIAGGSSAPSAEPAWGKVPAVTLGFWLIKILATTLGETGGDALSMSDQGTADAEGHTSAGLGYLLSTVILAAPFLISVSAQMAVRRFHPFLFWFVIVATTTLGTTLADFCDRSLHIGYAGGSLLLLAALMASLGLWRWSMGTVSIESIASRKAEAFYWATILFSQTLGTALGDWTADKDGLGLGFELGALVFGGGLALVGAGYLWTGISRTALFWTAFILTRPLGATLGDLLDKGQEKGGMELPRYAISAALAVAIVLCILILPQRASRSRV